MAVRREEILNVLTDSDNKLIKDIEAIIDARLKSDYEPGKTIQVMIPSDAKNNIRLVVKNTIKAMYTDWGISFHQTDEDHYVKVWAHADTPSTPYYGEKS